jgi:serine/threonine protein kinase
MQNSIQSEFNQLFLKMENSDPKKIGSIKDAWLNDSDYRRLILSTLEDVFLTELSPMNGKVSHVSKIASTPREEPPAKLMQNGGVLKSAFHFTLKKMIGRGGAGDVWCALAPGGIPVAIKMIPLVHTIAFKERRSLETFSKIRHQHIISVMGYWEKNGTLWVEMELADCNLLELCERETAQGKKMPLSKLLDYFEQAAEAIDFLNHQEHQAPDGEKKNLQHGDIKLTNLLMVGDCLKVADFGLGRSLALDGETQHSGSYTAIYAPPEFFDGKAHANSDQYSLAICYARLRVGEYPFHGSMLDIMHGHCFEEPDLGDLPEMEKQVLVRALAKKPEDRWPSACQFMAELRKAVAGMEISIPWSTGVGQGCSCD